MTAHRVFHLPIITALAWSVAVFAQDAKKRFSPEEREARRTMSSPASIDEVFDTPEAVARLAEIKEVRLFRGSYPQGITSYGQFELEDALQTKLATGAGVAVAAEDLARPVLKLASDYDNYGYQTKCGFSPGLAVILGDSEPAFVLVCCFSCHDIHVIRRPSKDRPGLHVARIGMSPTLEAAILELARKAFPEDHELRIKLQDRLFSTIPASNKRTTEALQKMREASTKPKK